MGLLPLPYGHKTYWSLQHVEGEHNVNNVVLKSHGVWPYKMYVNFSSTWSLCSNGWGLFWRKVTLWQFCHDTCFCSVIITLQKHHIFISILLVSKIWNFNSHQLRCLALWNSYSHTTNLRLMWELCAAEQCYTHWLTQDTITAQL